jgi:hypothetical protein
MIKVEKALLRGAPEMSPYEGLAERCIETLIFDKRGGRDGLA